MGVGGGREGGRAGGRRTLAGGEVSSECIVYMSLRTWLLIGVSTAAISTTNEMMAVLSSRTTSVCRDKTMS